MGRKPTISRDRLLDEALALLEGRGLAAVTMRALAARLGVDPMAAYHWFPDKDALLRAAAARAYGRLAPRAPRRSHWQGRVAALAHAYVALLARHRELLRYLTAGDAAPAAAIFDAHFAAAIAPLRLAPRAYRTAQHALVDFLHGFALAGPGLRRRALDDELRVITLGISSLARV
jgi:AcrR family transcriptional regulator